MRYDVTMYQRAIRLSLSISFWTIVVLAALVPLFFLPASWGGVVAVKSILLYTGVFVATLAWLVAQFLQGAIMVPNNKTVLLVGVWTTTILISAFASANSAVSLWGRGFSTDSWIMTLVLALLVFLVASFAHEQRRLLTLFLAICVGSALTVLLQVVLFVLPIPALAHIVQTGTVVGTWVDFSYLVTLTLVTALLMYEVLAPKGFFKVFALATMVLCVIVLVFLNFVSAWIVAIISALLVFVYNSSVERSLAKLFPRSADAKEYSGFPFVSFGVLLVGIFFVLTSASIGARIAQSINLTFTDIRPSFSATTTVMQRSLAQDPVLGTGPGRFGSAWDLYHPIGINQTAFWNTTFESGFSTIQTFVVTHGLVPSILLCAIIIVSIVQGFRLFGHKFPDRFSRFIAVASLIMVIAYAALMVLTSVGIVLTVLGFLYIGLLIGVSQLVGKTSMISWAYLKDPRKSFVTILVLVVSMIVCVVVVYQSGQRFASIVYFNKALTAERSATEGYLTRALALSPNDVYWRGRTALYTNTFVELAQTSAPEKAALQQNFDTALASAQSAVVWDRTDARNWLTLAQVYQLVGANGNADALVAAQTAADEAQKRSPVNPLYLVVKGQLAFLAKDYTLALDSYTAARERAPGQADAWVGMIDSLSALGRKAEALQLLDTFATTFPTIEGVQAKKAAIQGVTQESNSTAE